MWDLIVGGTTYNLNDLSDLIVGDFDGAGMAPVRRFAVQATQQDGATDYGYRLQPRAINLVLWAMAETRPEKWDQRAKLLRLFRPSNTPLKLRNTDDNFNIRQIDCYYDSGLSMATKDEKGGILLRQGITLIAPDPTFYDPTMQVSVITSASITSGMDVPTPVPTPIGASNVNKQLDITYSGTWRSYPTLRLFGPITNPIIDNMTTGKVLDFTGITIANGDYYEIDTAWGAQTIVDSLGANKLAELSTSSDLAQFYLQEAQDGSATLTNTLRLRGSSIGANTQLQILYYTRDIGI